MYDDPIVLRHFDKTDMQENQIEYFHKLTLVIILMAHYAHLIVSFHN